MQETISLFLVAPVLDSCPPQRTVDILAHKLCLLHGGVQLSLQMTGRVWPPSDALSLSGRAKRPLIWVCTLPYRHPWSGSWGHWSRLSPGRQLRTFTVAVDCLFPVRTPEWWGRGGATLFVLVRAVGWMLRTRTFSGDLG